MPHSRELLSQETPQEYLSVGGAFSELQCGAVTQDPLRAPFAGESYETVYPATHYLLTAGSTALVHATVPVISWFQSARLASGVWLPALALLVVALVGTLGGHYSGLDGNSNRCNTTDDTLSEYQRRAPND